jgi:hypothetical protein
MGRAGPLAIDDLVEIVRRSDVSRFQAFLLCCAKRFPGASRGVWLRSRAGGNRRRFAQIREYTGARAGAENAALKILK